jgi:RNA polymerase sigma-70 factor (ECF subfamily)
MPPKKIKKTHKRSLPRTEPSLAPEPPSLPPVKSESRTEDARLIQRALRGDQFAFKHLLKKYHDPIFNLVYRMIHDKQQVEDLTQETFVKAFASLKYFNDEYAFSTWLYKIATNSSIDFIRKKKLNTFSIDKPVAMEESDFSFELPDTTYQPDKTLIQGQRSKMIEEAINKLPEKYRKVIILRHTEERDYAEIAKILKLPIGTVKAHIFRARELLNKALRDTIRHY